MELRRSKEAVALGILVLTGAALRFWNIGTESLWQDEAWSWGLIQGNPKDLVLRLYHFDAHPPLYFLCLQAWSLFGSSEAWRRSS